MHLATEDRIGLIVADMPGGGRKEDEEFLEGYLKRMTTGTDYVVLPAVQACIRRHFGGNGHMPARHRRR
jgi:hypothetical protein